MQTAIKFLNLAIITTGIIILLLSLVCLAFYEIRNSWDISPSFAQTFGSLFALKYDDREFYGIVYMLIGAIAIFACLTLSKFLAKGFEKAR